MCFALSLDPVLTAIALIAVFLNVVLTNQALDAPLAVTAGFAACVFEYNRMYEVLGLFALLLVGIMLTSKAGHPVLSGCEVDFMSRGIFYFVPVTAMQADVVQRCRLRKITAQVAANPPAIWLQPGETCIFTLRFPT